MSIAANTTVRSIPPSLPDQNWLDCRPDVHVVKGLLELVGLSHYRVSKSVKINHERFEGEYIQDSI